jgi:hypothetical protein
VHYLFIFRRCGTHGILYSDIAYVLRQLAAPGLEWQWHKTHAIYQVLFVQRILKMCKYCSKHVAALNFLINLTKGTLRWFHYTLLCFQTSALEGGKGSASRPGRFLPPGKTWYPLYRRLGGSQVRSGQVRKISPPNGIRSPDRSARSQSLYRLSYHRLSYRARTVFN